MPFSLFDTAGIEVGGLQSWYQGLQAELLRRGSQRPVSEWFHTIIYCVDGTGERITDAELNLIEGFIERKHRVIVVITKSGKIAVAKRQLLAERIESKFGHGVKCIFVNSVEEKLPTGPIIESFGLEDLKEELVNGFWESLRIRMPDRCIALLHECINGWRQRQKKTVRRQVGRQSAEKIAEQLEEECDEFTEELVEDTLQEIVVEELKRTVEDYGRFLQSIQIKMKVEQQSLRLFTSLPSFKKLTLGERFSYLVSSEDEKIQKNADRLEAVLKKFAKRLKNEIIRKRPLLESWINSLLQPN